MNEELEEEKYFVGDIQAIFFQNQTNFYKVLLVKVMDTNTDYLENEIVVTGSFGQIQEEEVYRFFGKIVEHPRYGTQFQTTRYQQERPTSINGVVTYLSSDKFPGIGKRTAEKIVELIGEDVLDKIIENPDLLKDVPQLNEKKRQTIITSLQQNHGMEQAIICLNQYGFGSQLSFAIYQQYKEQTLEIIHENPYQLVEDIDGIGFKRADNLAEQLGIDGTSHTRIRAAIMHEIFQLSIRTGNTYVEAEILLKEVIQTLENSRPIEISVHQVADQIICLVEEDKIQQEGTKLFENSLYFAEWGVGQAIHRLVSGKQIQYDKKEIKQALRKIEQQLGITYGSSQQEAIEEAICAPLFILTGGPGTGKTTVINGIVSLFAELNGLSLDIKDYTQEIFPILLAAPTGRAAKRMNETTGLPASTIHRLLGLSGKEKNYGMTGKELEGGLLIIDEMSMIDTWLANTLLKAVPTTMQVIFVGDKDQLSSVGPGQILRDLLTINELPKKELQEIYRQGDGSSIIQLAHEIKEGRLPQDFTTNQTDRSFFAGNAQTIEPYIRQIVTKAKERGFSSQEIQVLAPMYRGAAGINALNKMMQEIFNPNEGKKKEVAYNDQVYRIGDKVLQLINTPELNVFNGDMGKIVGINLAKDSEDKTDELIIQFDANEVCYKRNEWNKITLSYCCSIHKAQGSEFKMVILPMIQQYQRMLQRNLLYTAVTRSREILILLGEVQAFQTCVNQQTSDRLTMLQERILTASEMTLTTQVKITSFEEEKNSFGIDSVDSSSKKESLPEKSDPRVEKHPINNVEKISLFDLENNQGTQNKPSILTMPLIEKERIDPLIGMAEVRPFDFMLHEK